MSSLFFNTFLIFTTLNLFKITICLQDNILESSLANADLDNSFIQLNHELLRESEALNLIKKSKISSLTNNSQSLEFDLSCFTCSTTDDPNCERVNGTRNNELIKKCRPDEPYCSTLRIEYKVIKESNWTLWRLERSCLRNCEPICIQLGERTRLRFCNECCSQGLCNVGNHELNLKSNLWLIFIVLSMLYII